MKKLTLILAALVLTLGFSQCKKTETPTMNEGVFITLTAGYGNGAKTSFDPANGTFAWTGTTESPEYIYVGGNSTGYLGYLTSTESGATVNFSGTITPGAADATLYFFYLGKGDHAAATSVDFSSQDGTLENVTNYHIAISEGVEYAEQTSFSTTLNMKMAIAYFDVNGFKNANDAAETVYLHGDEVYSSATIDYTNGTITGNAKGYINLGMASNGKYVALIPSVSTETTLKFDSNSKWGAMNFLRGIQAGRYYSNSGAALTVTAGALLEGTVPGLFSVSATKMVRFSKGNLQYIGSAATPYWKFAEHQWDYLGTTTSQNSTSATVDRDLFGWGTSGYHDTNDSYNTNYHPWSTSSSVVNQYYNYYGYGPSSTMASVNLTDGSANYDWGINNRINNGGNTANLGWYTPSSEEWNYLLNIRETSKVNNIANTRFAKAFLFGTIHGLILFPDNYIHPEGVVAPTGINATDNTSWGANQYNATDWEKMEIAGAVFLPAGGIRGGNSVSELNQLGWYWSSTAHSNNPYACVLYFNYSNSLSKNTNAKYLGFSVRLIHNAGLIVSPDVVNDVTTSGSIFSGWTNDGGDPWDDPTPGSGGSTLGGWNNEGNNPWGN